MRNSEHYPDPTAGEAIKNVDPKESTKFISTPVYTFGDKQKIHIGGPKYVAISEMDLDEIKTHLKSCAKSNGDYNVCVNCGGCRFGIRVKEILSSRQKTAKEEQFEKCQQKGRQANIRRAMLEYKDALDSGDPISYILSHSKISGDEEKRIMLAKAKLYRWKKTYGGLIMPKKEVPKAEPVPVQEFVEQKEEPHLMQMPCLSKKVAAERMAAESDDSFRVAFIQKFNSLRDAKDELQRNIDELLAAKDTYMKQISAMITTANCMGIEIS